MNSQRPVRRAVQPMAVLLLATFAVGCTSQAARTAPPEWDGLVRQPSREFDAVYLRPGVDFRSYRTVSIDPVQVAFDRNWDPNRTQRDLSLRLSTEDIERIRQDMAAALREVFTDELAAGGYRIVEQPASDTLRLSPSLVDVYINAPDVGVPQVHAYTLAPGDMKLELEARDVPTGQIVARIVDENVELQDTYFQLTNSVTNAADVRRVVRKWAVQLRKGLDQLGARGE